MEGGGECREEGVSLRGTTSGNAKNRKLLTRVDHLRHISLLDLMSPCSAKEQGWSWLEKERKLVP